MTEMEPKAELQAEGSTLRLHEVSSGRPRLDRRTLRSLDYEAGKAALRPPVPPPDGALKDATGTREPRKTIAERMETWSRRAPGHNYDLVRFRGATMNKRTRQLLRRAERIMRLHFEHHGFRFEVTQGSYNDGRVSASGSTHDGGGALDIRTRGHRRKVVDDMVRAMRMAGFAAWSRGRGHDNFAPHIHAIAIGDRELSRGAANQVGDFARGRSGLSAGGADPDAELGAAPPRWAERKLDKAR